MKRLLTQATLCALLGGTAIADQAADVLALCDKGLTDFKDLTVESTMYIREPGSATAREVSFITTSKPDGRRMVRFTAPGDVKGMGFLVHDADTMYALLPAFGNRVRRLGTHVKGQSFMGSDLGFEDMSVSTYGSMYSPKLVADEPAAWILELTLLPGKVSEFPKLKMWVDKQAHQPSRIEYIDAAGKEQRLEVRTDFRKDTGSGNHYTPEHIKMVDHRRNDHSTELHLTKAHSNDNLGDDAFTVPALARGL